MPFSRNLPPALLAATALLAGVPPATGATAVQVSVEIPGGRTKSVRVRNLPKGASLAVRLRTNHGLRVLLVSAAELKRDKPQALFRGAVERSVAFRVVIEEAGDYILVLDNRRGSEAVRAQATIQATRARAPPAKGKGKVEETRA